MPATKVADVIVPEVFNPYVIERTAELSAIWQSGIVSTSPEIQARVNGGGRLVNMPFWRDLSGNSEVLTDNSALTVNNIGSGSDVAIKHFRGKAWGVNDLAKALSGDDPAGAIADLVARWWARDMQSILISTLKGVFASNTANDGGDMILSVSTEDGDNATDANLIGPSQIIDALGTLGDHWDTVAAIVMHSVPFRRLQKLDLITYEEVEAAGGDTTREILYQSTGYTGAAGKTIRIPYYLGKRVIVDDGCPVEAGTTSGYKYTTYLFGVGAIGWADADIAEATETDRDSLAGEDILIHRRHFILHPRGVKFTDNTVAAAANGGGPSNSELELAANWQRVYERKNVRLVALVTNG